MNIGYADVLGSGVRNLYKFTRIYSGGEPGFEEDDIFKLTVSIETVAFTGTKSNLTERQNTILGMIQDDNTLQVNDIAESFGVSRITIIGSVI
ncbi:DeoR family transcriptional regulator [Hungatella hathewayi]|uniref:DeoR family transcriptional regulator n=1 Tax=Hungatella hathewayi TaxID=154046 RepID=UPI00356A14EE